MTQRNQHDGGNQTLSVCSFSPLTRLSNVSAGTALTGRANRPPAWAADSTAMAVRSPASGAARERAVPEMEGWARAAAAGRVPASGGGNGERCEGRGAQGRWERSIPRYHEKTILPVIPERYFGHVSRWQPSLINSKHEGRHQERKCDSEITSDTPQVQSDTRHSVP